jgi:hypothetical protein
MLEWFEGLAGPGFATAVVWTFAALILLVIVLVIIRLIRSLTFGTFVAGGRNRKTRLAVMDATAVDSHRRLVLVRRDDIEHLLLIGGPTDVVVEREIRLGQSRRPAFIGENGLDAPVPARPRAPEPAPPPPARAPAPQPMRVPERAQQQPVRQPERALQAPARQPERSRPALVPIARASTREPSPPPRSTPPRLPLAGLPVTPSLAPTGISATIRQPPTPQPSARSNNLDYTLLRELEVTFDAGPPKKPAKPVEMTLDDEMTKLLGELSNHKR